MASAWGLSWGSSWGNSWGAGTPPSPPRPGGGGFVLSEKYFKDLRAAVERESAVEEKTRAQRRADQASLRKALETAWEDVKKVEPEAFIEAAPAVDFKPRKVNWAPLIKDHDAILRIVGRMEASLAARQRRMEAERQSAIMTMERLRLQAEDDNAVALIFLLA